MSSFFYSILYICIYIYFCVYNSIYVQTHKKAENILPYNKDEDGGNSRLTKGIFGGNGTLKLDCGVSCTIQKFY